MYDTADRWWGCPFSSR